MGAHLYRDLVIRGVTYPTAKAAAKALGVSPDAVRLAARKGTLHRVGTGRFGREPLPVAICGKVYASAEAAARELGLKLQTVYKAIAEGDPDRLLRPRQPPHQPWAQPIAIGALNFPSKAAASRALGFARPEFVAKALKSGSKQGQERIIAAAMQLQAQHDVREAA